MPRSQVYGAAERLEERGLVETQQSTPTQYRPVSLGRARSRLLDELERTLRLADEIVRHKLIRLPEAEAERRGMAVSAA